MNEWGVWEYRAHDKIEMSIKKKERKKVKKHLTILKEPLAKRWISNSKTLPEQPKTYKSVLFSII